MSVLVPIIPSIAAILRGLPPLQMSFSIFKSPGRDKYVTLSERDSVRLWMLWVLFGLYCVQMPCVSGNTSAFYGHVELDNLFCCVFYGSIKLENFNL